MADIVSRIADIDGVGGWWVRGCQVDSRLGRAPKARYLTCITDQIDGGSLYSRPCTVSSTSLCISCADEQDRFNASLQDARGGELAGA